MGIVGPFLLGINSCLFQISFSWGRGVGGGDQIVINQCASNGILLWGSEGIRKSTNVSWSVATLFGGRAGYL